MINFVLSRFYPKPILLIDAMCHINRNDVYSNCISNSMSKNTGINKSHSSINPRPKAKRDHDRGFTMERSDKLSDVSMEKLVPDKRADSLQNLSKGNHDIKCVTINVSGLNSKLNNGILDQYLANFDIILTVETNCDSPILKDTMLSEFSHISKKKFKSDRNYKYGGIHGISALISPDLKEVIELIPDTESECVLWLKIKSVMGGSFIMGSVYIPCDTSRFNFDEVFDQIERDIINLKIEHNLPICLAGDFNAHTGCTNDFLEQDNLLADLTGCEELGEDSIKNCIRLNCGFTAHRYNQDISDVNRNGKQLLAMCQTMNLRILNGRVGSDKYFGGTTTNNHHSSVIDYVIVCEQMLSLVSGFHIEMFDPCYSDVHCPIEFLLSVSNSTFSRDDYSETTFLGNEGICGNKAQEVISTLPQMKFNWSKEMAADFQGVAADIDLDDLFVKLSDISNNTTQTNMNNLCQQLNEKNIVTAKQVGAYKDSKSHNKGKPGKSKSQPWFDQDCVIERQKYYRVKNCLKRSGAKAMSYKKSKEFKKFITAKKKDYIINWKIKSEPFAHLTVRSIGNCWISPRKAETPTIKYVSRLSWNILRNSTVQIMMLIFPTLTYLRELTDLLTKQIVSLIMNSVNKNSHCW